MNTTIKVIDRIKTVNNVTSDYAVSKLLGVTRAAMSKYRNNINQFGDEVAFRAAELAKMNPYQVIASLHKEINSNHKHGALMDDMQRKSKLVERLQNQDVIDALKAAAAGKTTPSQRKILAEISEQCILCSIAKISEKSLFGGFNQNPH